MLLLIHQSNKLFRFDMGGYVKMLLTKVLPLVVYGGIISAIYLIFIKNDSFLKLIGFTLAFEALVLPFIWKAGLADGERQFVKKIISERLHLKKS